MISEAFAEKLYERIQGHMNCTFDSNELDVLEKVMRSEVVLKAFGRSLMWCQVVANEMTAIDMSQAGAVIEFSKRQGQINGVNAMIAGLLQLITKEEDEEEEEDDNQ